MPRSRSHFDVQDLAAALAPFGLILRGGFALEPSDDLGEGTLVMVGNAGRAMWDAFLRDSAAGDDPLDAWTRETIEPIATTFGARAVFPFDHPHPPFQQWAKRAEGLASSPLGILIHSEYGLWHAYRAALIFPQPVAALETPPGTPENPCESCSEKPCLCACPVSAFSCHSYDVEACAGHLSAAAGRACLDGGCMARNACPVGREYMYPDPQIRFHMAAFARSLARR